MSPCLIGQYIISGSCVGVSCVIKGTDIKAVYSDESVTFFQNQNTYLDLILVSKLKLDTDAFIKRLLLNKMEY